MNYTPISNEMSGIGHRCEKIINLLNTMKLTAVFLQHQIFPIFRFF